MTKNCDYPFERVLSGPFAFRKGAERTEDSAGCASATGNWRTDPLVASVERGGSGRREREKRDRSNRGSQDAAKRTGVGGGIGSVAVVVYLTGARQAGTRGRESMPQLSSLLPFYQDSSLGFRLHPFSSLSLSLSLLPPHAFILPSLSISFLSGLLYIYFLPWTNSIDHHHHHHRPLVDVDRRGEGAEATTTRCWLLMLRATGPCRFRLRRMNCLYARRQRRRQRLLFCGCRPVDLTRCRRHANLSALTLNNRLYSIDRRQQIDTNANASIVG